MSGFMFGHGSRKRWLHVSSWNCKTDGRSGCGCCMPKNVVHPLTAGMVGWKEYFRPQETGKTKMPRR